LGAIFGPCKESKSNLLKLFVSPLRLVYDVDVLFKEFTFSFEDYAAVEFFGVIHSSRVVEKLEKEFWNKSLSRLIKLI
jgi:hypothetical protein